MKINKEEIIKGKSVDYARTLVIVCLNIIAIVLSFIIVNNVYVPILITLLCVAFVYILITDFHFYEFHPDKIEITFPLKKAKNMTILKDEITSVLYNDQDRTGLSDDKSTTLTIYYEKGTLRDKFIIPVVLTLDYFYDSPIYKILIRIKNWNVKFEIISNRKELKSIIN